MKVLLVGGGGRAHALAWAISASPLLTKLYCAPGNAGIADDAQYIAGLWDAFEAAGIRATGPSKEAAILEGSKGFVKDLCREAGIPTAAYGRFRDPVAAKAFADKFGRPVVIKADGLAAGKGVIIPEN